MLRACGEIDVGHDTLVHATLDAEVEHGLLLTVLNAADAREVALLVVGLDTVDDVRRQVLEGRLRVARHELLTIDEDLLDLLAIDLDGTVVADLSARQTLDELLDNRALGRAERARVIYKGIGLERHLRGMSRHRGAFQHDGIGLEGDGAGMEILAFADGELLDIGLETYIGDLQGVSSVAGSLDREAAIGIRQCVGHYLLAAKNCSCGLNDGLLRILFNNLARYRTLGKYRDCHHQRGSQK